MVESSRAKLSIKRCYARSSKKPGLPDRFSAFDAELKEATAYQLKATVKGTKINAPLTAGGADTAYYGEIDSRLLDHAPRHQRAEHRQRDRERHLRNDQ